MWRHIASNAVTFLIVALFLLGGAILWGQGQYRGEGPLAQAICLKVDRGSTMSRVSDNLAEQGAISSPSVFRIGADYEDKTNQLKAGSFLVPENASMEEIVSIITRGGASSCGTEVVYRIGVTRATVQVRQLDPSTNRFVEKASFNPEEEEAPAEYTRVRGESDTRYRVALAEGVTSWQVVEELKSVDLLSGDVAEVPAEGMLAPDSYEITANDTRAQLIQRMLDAQQRRIAEVWAQRRDDVPLKSPEEMLTLASIIEKET
ncbi:endolytic transglycosylase MltG, partial [Planktotalea frisia]|uniref:endolytic transglycosylase MltG n=1 Tax=Planktotalea frisia TaxID=696762 RepID=UPI0023557E9E